MGWSAFGHVVLALLGTYLLCRRLRCSPAAATIGAIVFATAYMLPWLLQATLLEPGAWLPLLALMVVEILSGGGWRWVVALGAATFRDPQVTAELQQAAQAIRPLPWRASR